MQLNPKNVNASELPPPLTEEWKAVVAILGARMHYAVPSVLAKTGRLERFYTDFYLHNSGIDGVIKKILHQMPAKILRRAAMRSTTRLPDNLVKAFFGFGLLYTLGLRFATDEASRERLYARFGSWFGELSSMQGFGKAKVAYGINTASLEWFGYARKAGLQCVLEQCSAPYTIYAQLSEEEHQLWPGWKNIKYFIPITCSLDVKSANGNCLI